MSGGPGGMGFGFATDVRFAWGALGTSGGTTDDAVAAAGVVPAGRR